MFDDERLTLEPREGERISGSSGERAVVAIAALALLGGLFIVAANVITSVVRDPTAVASASAEASPSPDRTPRPSPTPRPLREFTITSGTPPTPRGPPGASFGFLEARVGLAMWNRPRADATQVGVLRAGQLAFAEDMPREDDWLYVSAPTGGGWIQVTDGTTGLVEPISTEVVPGPDVWSVIAGGEEYVALASHYTESNPGGQLVLHSADGVSWRETTFQAAGAWTTLVAWGPAGWLAVSEHESPSGTGTTWVSRLADDEWSPLGSFSVVDYLYPGQLIGSEIGYLLTAQGAGRGFGPEDISIWFSTDGISWRESAPVDLGGDGWVRVAPVPGGFYAWNVAPGASGASSASGAFSANGRAWSPVTGGPNPLTMQLVRLGDGVVALDVDPSSAMIRAWE